MTHLLGGGVASPMPPTLRYPPMTTPSTLSPSVVKNALDAIVDEMAYTVIRTTTSEREGHAGGL
jgi:hypothetical protein